MDGRNAEQRRSRRSILLKDKNSDHELSKLTYEEALERLEMIVNKLEDSEIPLEESLSTFQEGIALSRYCREKLAEIEFKVEYLLKEEQQNLKANSDHTDNGSTENR
jgi:exodeoxyribonuclease VII small subunit